MGNGSHWFSEPLVRREDICGSRWAAPAKCTPRLLEVPGMFIFMKLLTACIFPPAFLLACVVGKSSEERRRIPFCLGIVKRTEADVEHLDLVLWLPFLRKP